MAREIADLDTLLKTQYENASGGSLPAYSDDGGGDGGQDVATNGGSTNGTVFPSTPAGVQGALNSSQTWVNTNDFPALKNNPQYPQITIHGQHYVPLQGSDALFTGAGIKFDDPPGTGLARDQIVKRVGSVGLVDQQCVTLAEAGVGIRKGSDVLGSSVWQWRPGNRVMDGGVLPGTPISTFLSSRGHESQNYAGGTGGREGADLDHAAIFLGYLRDKNNSVVGINVLEQYKGSGGVHQHAYMMNNSGGEHDARMYRVVMDTKGNYLGGANNPMTNAPVLAAAKPQDAAPQLASVAATAPASSSAAGDGKALVGYFNSGNSPGASGQVAVAIPSTVAKLNPEELKGVVIVPYFHGFGGGIEDSLNRQKLVQQAEASGKKVVFVVPQLGDHSDTVAGWNPAKFMQDSQAALTAEYVKAHPGVNPETVAKIFKEASIAPVSYSGGYIGAAHLLSDPETKARTAKFFGLDTVYGKIGNFADAARSGIPLALVVGPSTKDHTGDLFAALGDTNLSATRLKGPHDSAVQDNLGALLKQDSILPKVPSAVMAAAAPSPEPSGKKPGEDAATLAAAEAAKKAAEAKKVAVLATPKVVLPAMHS